LYEQAVEENRLLLTRESLAAEEAEQLGIQNAELLSHSNGDQRISYVEQVRQEMAMTKYVCAGISATSQSPRPG
jgi:hypothetical protein